MDCDDGHHSVSGERCLFLLLLNEDGPDETRRLSGKDRLLKAWEFKGDSESILELYSHPSQC